jgi:hypothetical protein
MHEPGQNYRAHDHDIARDHEDDEPARHCFYYSERDVDRDQHRLVRERIKIGTELGAHAKALGQKAVDGVGDAGCQEQGKCEAHLACRDRPNHDRHQQDTAKGDKVGNAQLRFRLGCVLRGCSRGAALLLA